MNDSYQPRTALWGQSRQEQIQARIRALIRLYLAKESGLIAMLITEHINALLAHPDFNADIEQRCAFRRMATHWRCIAWINGT